MPLDVQDTDRSYRRGAVMGLTMAEAFVLIAFALLLLFAFWRFEVDKANTPDVLAFKGLSEDQKTEVLASTNDGSIEAFIALKNQGFDFSKPPTSPDEVDKWRFVDKDELQRLLDGAASLPEDVQRSLANLVEADKATDILQQMDMLEDLIEAGQSLPDVFASSALAQSLQDSGKDIGDLLKTAEILKVLSATGQSVEDLVAMADTLNELERAGQSLGGIAGKIKAAELQKEILVSTMREELGAIVAGAGGEIDENGAMILPESVLFPQGQSTVSVALRRFLQKACTPWLDVLKRSGVDISEVKIEGHASSEWGKSKSAENVYLKNLNLSQLRSQAVSRTCLEVVKDPELKAWARGHLVAVGYSSSRPILRDNSEDPVASRRVVFSVTPDREALIDQIENEATTLSDKAMLPYDRDSFGSWADLDGDCQNTRHEILAAKSQVTPTFVEGECSVLAGIWEDPYTGKILLEAGKLEVDHLVPLKWAWEHGASGWSTEKKLGFNNDLNNLVLVERDVNKAKGAKGPEEWLPPNIGHRCEYVQQFQIVIQTYEMELSLVEAAELAALRSEVCVPD